MRVLIVDDDENVREIFTRKCQQKGWASDSATSGDEALAKIAANHYDAVLLDLLIPGKDGYSCLKELKKDEKRKSVPIFAFTNAGGESSIKKALALGAIKAFIKANMNINDILTAVAEESQRSV